jgi:mRNA-degrading endonuclease YafQ of YafQ-DinJ toxin-antitoxin module
VLAHFDYEKPTRLETDASGFAIAGIILQPAAWPTSGEDEGRVKDRNWHPIAFWSHTMADVERNYSVGDQEMLAIVEACRHWRHNLEGSKYLVRVLTDHHNLQGFMKNKPLRGRLGRWWETLSGYDLEIVYRTGKTNSTDGLSRRPDYKATAEAEDRQKQAQETRASESEETHTGESEKVRAGESDGVRKEAVRIDTAQLLGPWGQLLAATVCRRLPMAAEGSSRNAYRLLATLVKQEDAEGEKELSPSMRELIKGLLGQDETARCFCAVYNLPKEERKELVKQQGRNAYDARDWAQDRVGIVTFKGFTYVPNVSGLRTEVIKTNHDLPWAYHYGVRRTLDLVVR